MKLTHLLVAGTALVSASALAAGNQAQQRSEAGQPAQQSQAQSGQSSEVVKQAQEKLSATGHDAGPADGIVGAKTQAAVKQFQQSKGLEASGQLDSQTLAALQIDQSGGSAATGSSASGSTDAPSGQPSGAGGSSEPRSKY